MDREVIVIDAPIDVRVADLPADIQARVIGNTMRVTYKWFRNIWTDTKGFQGDARAEAKYRAAHEIANPRSAIRN